MNNWKEFLDIPGQARFDPDYLSLPNHGSITVCDEGGRLLGGVENFITTNPACAKAFLGAIEKGQVNFGQQQRAVQLLLRLHQSAHDKYSRLYPMAGEVRRVLAILADRIEDFMRDEQMDLSIEGDQISERFGFGGHSGANHYALSVARSAGLCAFVRNFCSRASRAERVNDLCGDWHLVLTEPRDVDLVEHYAGTYGSTAHAVIEQKRGRQIWSIYFLDFPPWRNWYGLEGHAYEAAAQVLSQGLEATVTAVGELSN